jgi:hypothetical protein
MAHASSGPRSILSPPTTTTTTTTTTTDNFEANNCFLSPEHIQ